MKVGAMCYFIAHEPEGRGHAPREMHLMNVLPWELTLRLKYIFEHFVSIDRIIRFLKLLVSKQTFAFSLYMFR